MPTITNVNKFTLKKSQENIYTILKVKVRAQKLQFRTNYLHFSSSISCTSHSISTILFVVPSICIPFLVLCFKFTFTNASLPPATHPNLLYASQLPLIKAQLRSLCWPFFFSSRLVSLVITTQFSNYLLNTSLSFIPYAS